MTSNRFDRKAFADLSHIAQSIDSSFALGGKIQIQSKPWAQQPPAQDESSRVRRTTVRPITIRWDGEPGANKITFSSGSETDPVSLNALVKACQPATFGHLGQNILDESYRKAGKLDEACFSTNFNPAECGITDSIAQALLPSIAGGQTGARGIHAELYKMNVYSGPSGHFHKHVDTPRGETQIGSLVVCLPSMHTGGDLVVRHLKTSLRFDWSKHSAEAAIQWAAFYSDCEHEVLEVTNGHRITLTYNLYACFGLGQLAGRHALDPRSLPLFQHAKSLIDDPAFMRTGGYIGFYCTHDYAHTTSSTIKYLPWCLKGLDMIMYETFKALKCRVLLRPVYDQSNGDDDEMLDEDEDDYPDESDERSESDDRDGEQCFADYLKSAARTGGARNPRLEKKTTVIGNQLGPMQFCGEDQYSNFREVIKAELSCKFMKNIHWLNEGRHSEKAIAYIKYGNEASLEHAYSSAALFVKVGTADERISSLIDGSKPQSSTHSLGNEGINRNGAAKAHQGRFDYVQKQQSGSTSTMGGRDAYLQTVTETGFEVSRMFEPDTNNEPIAFVQGQYDLVNGKLVKSQKLVIVDDQSEDGMEIGE